MKRDNIGLWDTASRKTKNLTSNTSQNEMNSCPLLNKIIGGDSVVYVLRHLDLKWFGRLFLVCQNWNSIFCSLLEKTKLFFKNCSEEVSQYIDIYCIGQERMPTFLPRRYSFGKLMEENKVNVLLYAQMPPSDFSKFKKSMFSMTTKKQHLLISQYSNYEEIGAKKEYCIKIKDLETKSESVCSYIGRDRAECWSCNPFEFFGRYVQELELKIADDVYCFFMNCGGIDGIAYLNEKEGKEGHKWDIFPEMDMNEFENIVSQCEQVLGSPSICKELFRKIAQQTRLSKYIYRDKKMDDQWMIAVRQVIHMDISEKLNPSVLKQVKSEFKFIDYYYHSPPTQAPINEIIENVNFRIYIQSIKQWLTFSVNLSANPFEYSENSFRVYMNITLLDPPKSHQELPDEEIIKMVNQNFGINWDFGIWELFFCSLLPHLVDYLSLTRDVFTRFQRPEIILRKISHSLK
eukprot:TRINITY_DN16151_c0_g1_i1.p1 TRINITY_DN16151_c0_g1~~TRINITY_DN16151_c0_g1_i1.p1  ORF type:complete len:461 (+),score=104.62 TRINITY_DN16151_c0_g1_i1:2-1384(+)